MNGHDPRRATVGALAQPVAHNRQCHPAESTDGLFAVNGFVGVPGWNKPATSPVANTLRLPVPVVESGEPPLPELTSKQRPPQRTNSVIDRIVAVPLTAVVDNDKTMEWRLENSPFYTIERLVFYDLLIFEDNGLAEPQTKGHTQTVGITKEQSQTYSINTGISITYESGVEVGGFSSSVAVQLSIELGYSTTTSVSVFQTYEDQAQLTTPAGTAAALWVLGNEIRVRRADGTAIARAIEFKLGNSSYVTRQFPAPAAGGPMATYRRTRNRSSLSS